MNDLQSITESLRVAVGAITDGVAALERLEALSRAETLNRAGYEELDNYYQQSYPDYTKMLRSSCPELERLRQAENDLRDVQLLLEAYENLHPEEFGKANG